MNEFTFPTMNQIFGNKENKLGIFEEYGLAAAATDFAICCGCYVNTGFYKENNMVGSYYTKDKDIDSMMSVGVSYLETKNCYNPRNRGMGARPMTTFENLSDCAKIVSEHDRYFEVEYGEYPQEAVSEEMQLELTNLLSSLKATVKNYTIDSMACWSNADFTPESLIEYEYNNKKYVRVQAKCSTGGKITLSNRIEYFDGDYVWIEVQPVRWLVDKIKKTVIAKRILFAGIPLDNSNQYEGDFEKTIMQRYLNDCFVKDIIPSKNDMKVNNEFSESNTENSDHQSCSSDDMNAEDIIKKLDTETQKKLLMMIEESIKKYNLEENIDDKLEEKVNQKLEEYKSKIQVPVVHIVKLNDTVLGQTKGGFYHEKFEQILSQVQLDEPIMLIGPAGSGKNVAISQVADALGQHMYYTNNASNEFKLTGFIDAGGNYRDTEFYKAFKNGGIFFLDEIDCSDPSALIVINSALANGYMAFPHETIDRHPDFRVITAANTWGKGADLQYVGRNALDGATLDRFDNIFFDYDTNLERALYPNDEILEFMWSFRNAVYQSKIPHIVSTRGIGKVYKKEINGIPLQDILTSNIVKNLSQDDVNIIIGNMQNVSSSNKYYNGIKSLGLHR